MLIQKKEMIGSDVSVILDQENFGVSQRKRSSICC